MDFVRNLFDYFRGSNTRREDENKYFPGQENNDSQNTPEIPRSEVDIELLPDFHRTLERNRTDNNDIPGYHLRNFEQLFDNFSRLTEVFGHFEEAFNEIERVRFVFGSMGFEDFSGDNFGDMRDLNSMSTETGKTLTGERLRNYYLSGNNADTSQEGSQILALNDKETCDNEANLYINKNNRSDFTISPHFKSQSSFIKTEIRPDGIAEITTILKDESGNEERIVKKVRLF